MPLRGVYGKPQLQSIPETWNGFSHPERWALMQHMRAAMVARLMDNHGGELPDHPLVTMFTIPLIAPGQSRVLLRELLRAPIEASCMLRRDDIQLNLVLRIILRCTYGSVVIDCIYPLVEKAHRLSADPQPTFHLVQPPGCLFVDHDARILSRSTLTRRIPGIYRLQYAWVFDAFVLPFCESHQILMANQWFNLKISLAQHTITIGPGNDDIH